MNQDETDIRYTGRVPGAVGLITACHAIYYHEHWGLDLSFEVQVATELSAFLGRFDPSRDGLWLAWSGDVFAGSVAVDGDGGEGARLRWFITAPAFRGRGIGQSLLQKAVRFSSDAGHDRLFLWTFRGLDRARSLYERAGFRLAREHEVTQWGQQILEQRFDLPLRG
jgi:GNAT superfamily N-acetyltransferase